LRLTQILAPCYAFAVDETKAMDEVRADVVIACLGVTTQGFIGTIMQRFLKKL
jgi:predicted TIM-barrel enzyme